MISKLRSLWRSKNQKRRGQTMAEYAMLIAVIAIVVFASYNGMGQAVENMFAWQVDNDLTSAS